MDKQTSVWPAPAKLNLFLYVTGQRADGYHELQTLFQFVDHSDFLHISLRDDLQIVLTPEIPGLATEDNLIYRAAKLLQQHSKVTTGANIHLEKVLPMGGGIGGGSSNAATALVALNQLWGCELDEQTLGNLGLQLGADVPIFVHGHSAFAEGVGEKLTDVSPKEPWYLVLVPDVHVSTPAVFKEPELPRNTAKRSWTELENASWENDCQQIVIERFPEVAQALSWLLEYAPSRMTGTGACVFAEFDSEQQAREVLALSSEKFKGFVAKACNRSPLLARLQQWQASNSDKTGEEE